MARWLPCLFVLFGLSVFAADLRHIRIEELNDLIPVVRRVAGMASGG